MKAAFIDVDGTLTYDTSSWVKVHSHFDVVEEMEKHTAMFYNGDITYEEWAKLDVDLWKGQSYSALKEALLPPSLVKGAKEGISLLKEKGYDVILISGGINVLVDEVADLVGADEAFSNRIGHLNGKIDGSFDIMVNSKSEIVNKLAQERNYDLLQSIAIGDNVNDLDMFELVGTSVACNTNKIEVIEKATYEINTSDFREVVKLAMNNS